MSRRYLIGNMPLLPWARFMVLALAALMISFTPVSADDTLQSASILTEGVSSSGYVCYDDGCSPTDQTDWWKSMLTKEILLRYHFQGLFQIQA